jgi:hypothetical protein
VVNNPLFKAALNQAELPAKLDIGTRSAACSVRLKELEVSRRFWMFPEGSRCFQKF